MPIDLHALAKDKRQIEFEFGGMTMPVVYRPSVMTGRFAQQLTDGETIDDLTEQIVQVIVEWDLKDGDKPIPVSTDALASLPTAMLRKMMDDIAEDSGLTPPEGKVMPTPNRQARRSKAISTASNGT